MACKIQDLGGIVTAYKTDCVEYCAPNELILEDCWETNMLKYKSEVPHGLHSEHERHTITRHIEVEETRYQPLKNVDEFLERGGLLCGMGGTGKTYILNQLMQKIGEDNYISVAPTNVASLLVDGITCDKLMNALRNGKTNQFNTKKYIIVDEISMVKEINYQYWANIKMTYPDVKFIIAGDFTQLMPVNDNTNRSYLKSRILFELVEGRYMLLEKCQRTNGNGLEHFELCANMVAGVDIDTTPMENNQLNYINLSFTNEKRKEINLKCMYRYMREHSGASFDVKALDFDANTQDFTYMVGMPVISRKTTKRINVLNNEQFVITNIENDEVTVTSTVTKHSGAIEVKEVTIRVTEFAKQFNPSFCMTIHKSQGSTFNQPYTIHEWGLLSKRLRYVAISRTTDIKNVCIKDATLKGMKFKDGEIENVKAWLVYGLENVPLKPMKHITQSPINSNGIIKYFHII